MIDISGHSATISGKMVKQGDWLTLDGETGAIYLGRCRTRMERPDAELAEIERWRSKVA
jgi:pyruvate,orthophosphate dikinase